MGIEVIALDDVRSSGFGGLDVVGWAPAAAKAMGGPWPLTNIPGIGSPAEPIEVQVPTNCVLLVDAFNPFVQARSDPHLDGQQMAGPWPGDDFEFIADLLVNGQQKFPLFNVQTLRPFHEHYARPILAIPGGGQCVVTMRWQTTREMAHPDQWNRIGVRLVGRIVTLPSPT